MIDFPQLSLYQLDAKIDTCAYTSSLHCHNVKLFTEESEQFVMFHVLDPKHPEYENKPYRVRVHKMKNIRSSNRQVEERSIIKQKVQLSGKDRVIELSHFKRTK